jgi:uncharacterized protein YndB with AHSA1/START domain
VIQKSAYLDCAPARAFALFTERASDWWPEALRHTADPRSEIRMLADGRFWERATDGREVELGRVLAWEPARRLVLDFYPGTDAEHPTEVVVRFAEENGGTRVLVEHGPKPESAGLWSTGAPRFERSWDLMLAALQQAGHPADS